MDTGVCDSETGEVNRWLGKDEFVRVEGDAMVSAQREVGKCVPESFLYVVVPQ